jgi:alpha(1,3/1,4) fucosyltransferase
LETIKIAYADFWPEWKDENFIEPILRTKFDVVIDQKNPDVLFHSIFGGMRETPKYKCKKVLYLGENWRSDRFGADYSISFDHHSETNYRLPLWQVYLMIKPELKDRLFNRVRRQSFDHFCAFAVSNPSNSLRNSHFDKLHEYKRVESYGKVRTNNLGLINFSKGKYWRDAKDQYFSENTHKFMMAYENTHYPGYCTEKLMDAFLAGSLPLYWGDHKVGNEWNSNAFVHISKLGPDWIEKVKEIDNNKDLFESIYKEPVFTEEQKFSLEMNLSHFEEWLIEKITK